MQFWICPNCGYENEQGNLCVDEVVVCDSCTNMCIVVNNVEGEEIQVEEY